MKILVVIDQMGGGGAARVTSILCTGLLESGYDVELVTDNITKPISYPIPSQISIYSQHIKKGRTPLVSTLAFNFKYLKQIRRNILQSKPDLIIAVMSRTFFYCKMASCNLGIPVIASDHTAFNRKISRFDDFVRYHFYKYADALTILTHKDERLLGDKFPKKTVIYNPLSFPIQKTATSRRKNILCVGRFDVWEIKGFDLIINFWKKIEASNPEWTLEIAGTGSKASINRIESLIAELHLQHRIKLLGQVSDMKSLLQSTSIFALPSRMEGMPMALIEAMSQGCACISFDVGGAVPEIMTNDFSGFITDDNDHADFTAKLQQLISQPDLRNEFSKNATTEAAKFSTENFISKWESLIQKVCKK